MAIIGVAFRGNTFKLICACVGVCTILVFSPLCRAQLAAAPANEGVPASNDPSSAPAGSAEPPPSPVAVPPPKPVRKKSFVPPKPKAHEVAQKDLKATHPPAISPDGASSASAKMPVQPVGDQTGDGSGKAVPANIASKLQQAGAGVCAPQLNALALRTMANVATYNTVSKWPTGAVDKRLVSVTIGQKYPPGPVPYAATSLVASPRSTGGCDAIAVQILPSPLTCAKLQASLTAAGKRLGDLADIALIEDAKGDNNLLIPTSANTCVMVVLKVAFQK